MGLDLGGLGILLFSAVALSSRGVVAQVYEFKKLPIPPPGSFESYQVFFIYSNEDAPGDAIDKPFVHFESFALHPTTSQMTNVDPSGLVVSIVPYMTFRNFPAASELCQSTQALQKPRHFNVYSHAVQFAPSENHVAQDSKMIVHTTAAYLLVLTNCGHANAALLEGRVIVKNSYGFLPGNEYHKKAFHGQISLCYIGLSIAASAHLQLNWGAAGVLFTVMLLSVAESSSWWIYLNNWNESGVRDQVLFIVAVMGSVFKSGFCYIGLFAISKGWSLTHAFLDDGVVSRMHTLAIIYFLLAVLRELALSFWQSHALSPYFVFLTIVLSSIWNLVIFSHIFGAISCLAASMREAGQLDMHLFFLRVRRLLAFTLSIAFIALFGQLVAHLLGGFEYRGVAGWHYQWFLADGSSHLLFLLVLVIITYLWSQVAGQRDYAYLEVGHAKAQTVWAEEGIGRDEDSDGEQTFWMRKSSQSADHNAAATIGACSVKEV